MTVRWSGAIALTVLLAAAGCGSTKTVERTVTRTVTVPGTTKTGFGPPRVRVEYGHISSLVRAGSRYRMRFDPAWLLSGETANVAAAEDGVIKPGDAVPNDNYGVDEGHRLLTYLVAAGAHVTVLTRHGNPAQLGATPISVAELARIVDGTSTMKLFEPLDTGVWIAVDIDTVRAIDQQYKP